MCIHKISTLRDHLFSHATADYLRTRLGFLTDEGPFFPFGKIIRKYSNPVKARDELKKKGIRLIERYYHS